MPSQTAAAALSSANCRFAMGDVVLAPARSLNKAVCLRYGVPRRSEPELVRNGLLERNQAFREVQVQASVAGRIVFWLVHSIGKILAGSTF
jgi:hypothetical protein